MTAPRRLKRNALSNFAGLMTISLLPLLASILYVPLLGADRFGIVGAASFLLTFGISLDIGLGRAVTRRFAQAATQPAPGAPPQDYLATAHLLFMGLLLPFSAAVMLGADFLTRRWLVIPPALHDEAEHALWLLGPVIFLHGFRVMDLAALNGIERQGLSNFLQAGSLAVRLLLSLLVLLVIDRSILALLLTWLGAVLAEMLVIGLVTRHCLRRQGFPGGGWPRIALAGPLIRSARSDGTSTLVSIATNFADKLVLSRLLPIDLFGLYHIVSTLAAAPTRLTAPIAFAAFPRWIAQQADGDRDGFTSSYHAAAQIAGALILPTMIAGLLFAPRVLAALFPTVTVPPDLILAFRLLVIAGAASALNMLPYMAQLALGTTRVLFWQAILSGAVYLPLVLVATPMVGLFLPIGARLMLDISSFALFLGVAARALLPGEMGRLLRDALAAPLLGAALPCLIGAYGLQGAPLTGLNFALAILTGGFAVVGALLATPAGRRQMRRLLKWRRG